MSDEIKDIFSVLNIKKPEKQKNEVAEEKPVVIETAPAQNPAPITIENNIDVESMDADFDEARRNVLFAIDVAKTSLEDIEAIAKAKEGANEYNSLNNLLRTVADSSRLLMQLHRERIKIKERSFGKAETKNSIAVNNAVFVGSSSDLRKMLNGED